jgi:hypothetical protein
METNFHDILANAFRNAKQRQSSSAEFCEVTMSKMRELCCIIDATMNIFAAHNNAQILYVFPYSSFWLVAGFHSKWCFPSIGFLTLSSVSPRLSNI